MFSPLTPYLAGKIDGMSGRLCCPYEAGSQAADDYAAGYRRGCALR